MKEKNRLTICPETLKNIHKKVKNLVYPEMEKDYSKQLVPSILADEVFKQMTI